MTISFTSPLTDIFLNAIITHRHKSGNAASFSPASDAHAIAAYHGRLAKHDILHRRSADCMPATGAELLVIRY